MSPLLLSLRFLQAQPDSRLVALTRQGHGPAFEALVRRYRGELLAYCRRIQPRSGLAEDALQQTLLQAWKALSEGAEVREVRAWLYRIAHNVSLNHLRAANAVPREFAAATEQPELDQLVEQRLRARAALAGLASLPALQREALLSTTFDGASHTEVASALGLSSGAVRGLIYRARATLRAAAAAVVPGPMLHWAIRRTTVGSGRFPSAGGTFVGGGGTGAAGAIAKGGVVLVLAAASASGVVFTNQARHHQKPKARLMRSRHEARSAAGAGDSGVIAAGTTAFARFGAGAQPPPGSARATAHRTAGGEGAERGRGRGSGGNPDGSSGGGGGRSDGRGGSDGDSTGGSDGGSTSGSSDGDAATSMAPAAAPNTGSSEGGSSSGPDGGSGSSSGTSTSATSGSDLDTTAASATTASGTSSGSGGGASGGSDGSSGSSDGSSPSGG